MSRNVLLTLTASALLALSVSVASASSCPYASGLTTTDGFQHPPLRQVVPSLLAEEGAESAKPLAACPHATRKPAEQGVQRSRSNPQPATQARRIWI